jgi:hypothetical protein
VWVMPEQRPLGGAARHRAARRHTKGHHGAAAAVVAGPQPQEWSGSDQLR